MGGTNPFDLLPRRHVACIAFRALMSSCHVTVNRICIPPYSLPGCLSFTWLLYRLYTLILSTWFYSHEFDGVFSLTFFLDCLVEYVD
jgi:hypothetical protein